VAKTKTYSLKEVRLVVGGKEITGSGDTDKVSLARAADMWATKVDATGNGTREKSNDMSGKITITIHQTNPDCAVLDTLFADAEEKPNPDFISISCTDLNGGDVHTATECTAEKRPDAGFGKAAKDRVFVFGTAELKMKFGGNN